MSFGFSTSPAALAEAEALVEEGTLAFAMGDNERGAELLALATTTAPELVSAWHALAEVRLAMRDLDGALTAAEAARQLAPDDVLVHTSLSRIHMERGDKATAEHHGAQARMLSWKEELRQPAPGATP